MQRYYFYIYVYKLLDKHLYTLSYRTYLPAEYFVYKFMYWSIFKSDRLENRALSIFDIH